MDRYEMAHRWCNCDFGRGKGYWNSNSNVHCDEDYFYSYSTVYAMWLDKTEGHKLMVIMDHGCSNTSRQHLAAIVQAIPSDVKYIETSITSYYSYANVGFSKTYWQLQLPDNLLKKMNSLIAVFKDSRSITTRQSLKRIGRIAYDLNWLFSNRKDCKVNSVIEYMKNPMLAKLLRAVRKKLTPEELVDAMLGKGAYATYDSRLTSQKKAEKTRKFVEWFNKKHRTSLKKREIDRMPIAEKVKLACLPPRQKWEKDNESWYVIGERNKRLAHYLFGNGDSFLYSADNFYSYVTINRFTGERYDFIDLYKYNDGYWQLPKDIRRFLDRTICSKGYDIPEINFSQYKLLQNKDQWLKRFYQKCAIISNRHADIRTWLMVRDYTGEQLNQCSEFELAAYNRIQIKYSEYLVDLAARREAEERERAYLEAEKARLEEERKLKYNDYVSRGIEGYRALYYEKLDSISVANSFGSEFFFGGNVLLRWRTDEIIETSKNILLTIEQAKKIYRTVSTWHNDPTKFNACKLETKSGNYNAQRYENDILTAGCHQVAWCEMERMYNEILKREIA